MAALSYNAAAPFIHQALFLAAIFHLNVNFEIHISQKARVGNEEKCFCLNYVPWFKNKLATGIIVQHWFLLVTGMQQNLSQQL